MKIQKRRYAQIVLALIVMLVIGATMLVNSPRVQQRVSVVLASELENRIGTRVDLAGVRWLFPNDIVVDSLTIDDQEGEHLLSVGRVAAKVEWMPLIRERHLSVRNIRLFSPDIYIYKTDAEAAYNYQFLIDAFAGEKKEKKPTRLSMRVNSLLIRHANFKHRVGESVLAVSGECDLCGKECPLDAEKFTLNNLEISDLSAQLSLKMLSADSVSLIVRSLNFTEHAGICVDDLYFRVVANKQGATLANFRLDMPRTSLRLDTVWVAYKEPSPLLFKGGVLPSSYITPADFGCLLPQVGGITEKIHFGVDFVGSPSRISLKALEVRSAHRDMVLRAEAKAAWEGGALGSLNAELYEATLTGKAWKLLAKQAPHLLDMVPEQLVRVGNMTATGSLCYSSEQTNVALQATTAAGDIVVGVDLDGNGQYTATLDGDNLNVAKILPKSPLVSTNMTLLAKGKADMVGLLDGGIDLKDNFPFDGTLAVTATRMRLLDYAYEHISLEGSYAPGAYQATLALNDPNGKLALEGDYHMERRMPQYKVVLQADSLNLHAMQLIDIHEDATFSTHLEADFRGADLDHLMGKLEIDSFAMHRPTGDYLVKELALYASDPQDKMLSLKSDFMDATLRGELTYRSLANSLLGHLHHSIPSLCKSHNHAHESAGTLCLANVSIYNVEPLRELLLLPVSITGKAQLDALINDASGELKVTASVPQLEYDGNILKGISLDCHSEEQGMDIYVGTTLQNDGAPALTASLIGQAANNKANLGLLWNSNPEGMFDGSFRTQIAFALDDDGKLGVAVETDSMRTTINYSEWKLNPFCMEVNPRHILIDGLHFANGDEQLLSVDGVIARQEGDTLQVNFNNLDLGYLLTLVKLEGISFGGKVSGQADLANLYSDRPYIEADINAKGFAFCNGTMGDLDGHIHWDQDEEQLQFEADVWENPQHTSLIDGVLDLKENELWIDISADSINLSFLNTLLNSFMDDVKGNASGHLTVGGPLDAINLDGAVLADVAFNLTPTDVNYRFRDSLRFTPNVMRFEGIEAFDMRDQKAIVNGVVLHNNLKEFAPNLYVDVQNVLGIDLPDTGNDSFYTTIYGTGSVQVKSGPSMPLYIDVQAQPEKGSLFALNLASQGVSSSEAFITFVDRSDRRNVPTAATRPDGRRRRPQPESGSGLNLDIMAHVTPDATLKLVMNQAVDDHISVSGSGDLQINVRGDEITLFGTYTVNRGFYRLSLQDVINKNFDVISGSSVSFEGDPMAARLDITARHQVNYVPLRDLSPDMTGNVHVNCLLRIGGTLESPTVSFDLELPQGTEEEKSIVRSYTATEEQMNMQFIYLLGLGKFYTPDVAQTTGATGNMESLISSTISGQINNLLSGIISNENWNLASNIRTENLMSGAGGMDGENWENMEIEGILEGRLLDNRLLINGNFGYRDNPMYATNFIGDFDIRYLLTGGLSLKGYNKTNDRYFSKTSLTTQGVGLVFQRDFDKFKTRRNKRKKKRVEQLEEVGLDASGDLVAADDSEASDSSDSSDSLDMLDMPESSKNE
ncbi:MAG: translocation/assembly module TamB domain-containing protein [Bacteroidaceae bacterium]|nr:translocation/assembly module TamB domain-containing protein [Bacteroidaceae bacterium]